jgi:hypothetical protein
MGGPGSGGARNGGNKSNATRAKDAAKKDRSQRTLSGFLSTTSRAVGGGGGGGGAPPPPSGANTVVMGGAEGGGTVRRILGARRQPTTSDSGQQENSGAHQQEHQAAEDASTKFTTRIWGGAPAAAEKLLEEKRKEALKILRRVMDEGGFEKMDDTEEDDDEDNDGRDDNDEDEENDAEEEENDDRGDDLEHGFLGTSGGGALQQSRGAPPADGGAASSTSSSRSSKWWSKSGASSSPRSYVPQPGSPLAEYLKQVKEQFLFSDNVLRDHITTDGLHWIPPPADPVVSSNPSCPNDWYLSDVWCFVWDPFLQHKIHVGSCICSGCSKKGTLEINRYHWRPFFYFDKVVWILHRRLLCRRDPAHGGCGKSYASFDPHFMSLNMPARIAATFPFLVPKRGPGMHELMLLMFVELIVNRVQFGTFTKIFNSIYRAKYDQCRVSYYRTFSDKKERAAALGQSLAVPTPFGSYKTVGEYNGIKLTPGLVKRLFLRYMESHESYFQASFQLRYDEGNTADHTHKYANVIKASGRKGHIFTASYTIASLLGFINVARLVFTKSMYELARVMSDYKQSRNNANATPLKRFESDNLHGDGGLWMNFFKDELSQGVVAPTCVTVVDNDLPFADIKNCATPIVSTTRANFWARAAIRELQELTSSVPDTPFHIGLDTENNYSFDGSVDSSITHTLQICMPNEEVTVFHLSKMGATSPEDFPAKLKEFLEHSKIVACGRQIGGDLSRLRKLGVKIGRRIELQQLAIRHDPSQPDGTSLAALARRYKRLNLDKTGQSHTNDYSFHPLPPRLVKYAALDALLSLQIYNVISGLLQQQRNGKDIVEAPDSLHEGMQAELHIGGRLAAHVTISFVGAVTGGAESRLWGGHLVGKGKALVQIDKVIRGNARVPHLFKSSERRWAPGYDLAAVCPAGSKTIIMVNTSSLHISHVVVAARPFPPQNDQQPPPPPPPASCLPQRLVKNAGTPGERGGDTNEEQQGQHCNSEDEEAAAGRDLESILLDRDALLVDGECGGTDDEEGHEETETYWLQREIINVEEEEVSPMEETLILSRLKEDIWHQFKAMPLSKTCPLRTSLMLLLILGTFCFEVSGYTEVKNFLMKKRGIPEDKIMDHFMYNKEWWRRRVRMPVYAPTDQDANLKRVEEFCKNNAFAKKYWSDEMQAYFNSFRTKVREGKFSELHDVSLFRHDGVDSHGLDLWIRLRGSVRDENIHQKMRSAMGPWSIGCELGHYILLLLSYRYNVSTGIRRTGDIDFGHTCLWLIDDLQTHIQSIYNIGVYPQHLNIACFQSTNFVSVGIGPLTQSEEYVDRGDPISHLRGDIRNLAQRMKVKCPPLESKTREEYQIENEFFMRHPTSTMANFKELAKDFKARYDGIKVFPKLPTQIQASFKRWKQNDIIKQFLEDTKEEYNEIVADLTKAKVDGATIQGPRGGGGSAQSQQLASSRTSKSPQPQYVPPDSAPFQKGPVSDVGRMMVDHPNNQRCVWFPLCRCLASECNGFRLQSCINANSNAFKKPETEQEWHTFNNQKSELKKRDKAEKEKKRKKRKIGETCTRRMQMNDTSENSTTQPGARSQQAATQQGVVP